MTTTTWPANGEIKSDHPKRRKFSSEYKLKILAETDACASPSLVAAVLRREGLYASHLSIWRKPHGGHLERSDARQTRPKAPPAQSFGRPGA